MTTPRPVGTTRDGRAVEAWRLGREGGIEAEVWTRGAMLRSLTVPLADGRRVEVLQAPADLAAAEADRAYHDVVIGPVSNRIAGARYRVDGREVRLAPNEGRNLLHSGAAGWSDVAWRFAETDGRRCVLEHLAPADPHGFPEEIRARVVVSLPAPDTLEIAWEAQVSQPAPVAMTHHLYFNLSGGAEATILDHGLQLAASAYTPVGEGLIPTGEIAPVAGTALDLRAGRRIREVLAADDPQLKLGGGIDLNWALDRGGAPALRLRSPASGLVLEIETDQPGMQLYSGQGLKAPFTRYGALAIEPQDFPDAVNQPAFPPVVVRPGAPYRRWARYRFTAEAPGR